MQYAFMGQRRKPGEERAVVVLCEAPLRGVAPAPSSYILRGPSRKASEGAVDLNERLRRSLIFKELRRDGAVDGGRSSAGRAPGCDPGCRGFESHRPPHLLSMGR